MSNILGLLYLASPTLPIGSFAYSQGLEKAIDAELIDDRESLQEWCFDAMRIGLANLDLVFLSKLYHAITNKDAKACAQLNAQVFASRETAELLSEEKNLGQSIRRLIVTQDLAIQQCELPKHISFLYGFAYTGIALSLSIDELKTAFLWSWLENQTAVACKAVPLGQTDAQKILLASRQLISSIVQTASDDALFGSLPGQVMLSALHETQYSRLFRS